MEIENKTIYEINRNTEQSLDNYAEKIYEIVAVPLWDLNNEDIEKEKPVGESS